jgi:ATP-dependent helicase YprA (DUF1998 family)
VLGVPEAELELVDRSTAPRGRRRFFVYNPPVVNAELGVRASYLKSAVRLAADLVRARVPTIVFGPSRNSVEIMLKYLREETADARLPEGSLMAYRGGYLPDARRRIEQGLRDGDILCVVATNALELGIDIGALDAVICASYPGSLAALWQRFGRAGRRGEESACVLVASSNALDQYLAEHSDVLFDTGVGRGAHRPVEHRDPDPAPEVRGLRAALRIGARKPARRPEAARRRALSHALGFLAEHGVSEQPRPGARGRGRVPLVRRGVSGQ